MVSKESFKMTMPFYGNRAIDLHSGDRNYSRVGNGDINDLLAKLQEKSIEIDRENSTKEITYNHRNFTVPFCAQFPEDANATIVGYRLRGENISIRLKDYENTYPINPGAYGSPPTGDIGITCSIIIRDSYHSDRKDLNKIQETIEEFYDPFRELVERVQRENKPSRKKPRSMRKR